MDVDRLRMFLQIVETGTLSAAAHAVHLTQPALSRNLKLLEEELNVPLFDRRGRGLVLTAAGRALVPRARAIVEQIARTAHEVGRAAERGYFDLRLGAVDSVATALMPAVIKPLAKKFPDLVIKFSTARTAVLLDRIEAGLLDAALIAHSGPPRTVRSREIGRYALRFYGLRERFPNLGRVRSEAELRSFPIVEIEPPPGASAHQPESARSYAVVSNVATVKALVLSGFGVGDLPEFVLTPEEARQLAAAEVPHDPHCALYLASGPHFTGQMAERLERSLVESTRRVLDHHRAAAIAHARRRVREHGQRGGRSRAHGNARRTSAGRKRR